MRLRNNFVKKNLKDSFLEDVRKRNMWAVSESNMVNMSGMLERPLLCEERGYNNQWYRNNSINSNKVTKQLQMFDCR